MIFNKDPICDRIKDGSFVYFRCLQLTTLFVANEDIEDIDRFLQIIVMEDTKEYISYVSKEDADAQQRAPFDLLVIEM